MNNEKQKIAIAEARGMIGPFENSEEWFENGDSDGCIIVLRDATGKRVANYLNDLNAMHEAEQCLWRKDFLARDTFIDHLARILNPVHGYRDQLGQHLLDATAAQRAEAFLRTIGKWEEA